MNDKHKNKAADSRDKKKDKRRVLQMAHEKKDKNGKVKSPKEKKPAKGDFKCSSCGGNMVRRWIFPSSSNTAPYTQLQCENCGSSTIPRDIRYHENGYVWGAKIKKEKTEEKAS